MLGFRGSIRIWFPVYILYDPFLSSKHDSPNVRTHHPIELLVMTVHGSWPMVVSNYLVRWVLTPYFGHLKTHLQGLIIVLNYNPTHN